METGIDPEKLLKYRALAEKHLSDPLKLRLAIALTVIVVGIVGIYMQFSGRINKAREQFAEEKQRSEYIGDVEKLRKMSHLYQARIGKLNTTNDWVEYLLDGLSNCDVKLRDMESKEPKKLGAYKAISLSMEIEGTYPELKAYVEWLDMSEHLLRIDSLRFEKRPEYLLMKLNILGVIPR